VHFPGLCVAHNDLVSIQRVVTMNESDPDLVRRLKMYKAGASVHTVNKSRYYYTNPRIKPASRLELDGMIREALGSHDWSKLRSKMRMWW
jgi:hypothetical protein